MSTHTDLDTYTPPAQYKQPVDAVFAAVDTQPEVPKVSWSARCKDAATSLWALRGIRIACLIFGGIACALSIGFGLKFLWVVILGQTLTEPAAVLIVATSLAVTVVLSGAAIETA